MGSSRQQELHRLISPRRLMDDVRMQVDLGPRTAGNSAAHQLASLIADRFRKLNLATEVEQFRLPMTDIRPGSVKSLATGRSLPVWPFTGDPPYDWYQPKKRTTPVTGRLVDCGSLEDDEQVGSLHGKVALVRHRLDEKKGLAWKALDLHSRQAAGVIFWDPLERDEHVLAPAAVDLDQKPALHLLPHRMPIGLVGRQSGEVLLCESQSRSQVELSLSLVEKPRTCINVMGGLTGSPDTRKDTLVVCAHYDNGAQRPDCVGADDNASGVAVLLEVARAICALRQSAKKRGRFRPVVFLVYDAEEINAVGSWSWALDLPALLRSSAGLRALGAWEALVFCGSARWKRVARNGEFARRFVRHDRVAGTAGVIEIDTCGQGDQVTLYHHNLPAGHALLSRFKDIGPLLIKHCEARAGIVTVARTSGCNNVGFRTVAAGASAFSVYIRLGDGLYHVHTREDSLRLLEPKHVQTVATAHLAAVWAAVQA